MLGLSGSLRRASYCTAILRTLGEGLGNRATLDIFDLKSVPLYNQDEDDELQPESVKALKRAVTDCDGVLLISPEFNHGMTGVLKNALDWASRPTFASPFRNKPVLIMSASPAFTGGVRAQAQMLETLAAMLARVVSTPQVVIGSVHDKINDGRLVDEASLRFASEAIDDLLREIVGTQIARAA
ncbi:NADPH-dependent FMN reductase [Dyella sp. Tek66A03]|uniref:NADPH-dependent FMN reductase n=1 Tax=Dyella sp. Tek66A03 TaxID=3458298 RepID=UPI00403E4851